MDTKTEKQSGRRLRRFFKRGPWENGATSVIALGVGMLMQPFSKWAYSHSFVLLLIGLFGFVIVTHFPED